MTERRGKVKVRVMAAIESAGAAGIGRVAVAAATGLTLRQVSNAADYLKAAGLIRCTGLGPTSVYVATRSMGAACAALPAPARRVQIRFGAFARRQTPEERAADRALIDATCEHLIVLDGKGNVEVFHGGYSDWHEKDVQRRRAADREEAEAKARREQAERARQEAADRKKKQVAKTSGPSTNALARMKTEQIEEKIEKIENRIRAIDAELNDPATWRDQAKGNRLGEERQKLAGELEPLEFEWARRAEEEG